MDHGGRGGSSRGAEMCSVHSSKAHQGRVSANSNPRSGVSPVIRRQRQQHPQSKFDFYMPLCEIQQGLKRGEIVEGILRVNPRNYEDSYISAPDGLMDIYIKGIRDRNRALNGDVVAVKLRPPQDWKILWDVITDYEERQGKQIFSNNCQNANDSYATEPATTAEPKPDPGWASGWLVTDDQRTADSLEILNLDQLQVQFQEFTEESRKKRKPRNRSKKKRMQQKQEQNVNQQQSSVEQSVSPFVDLSSCDPNSNSNAEACDTVLKSSENQAHVLVDHFSANNSLIDFNTEPDQCSDSLNLNCDVVSPPSSASKLQDLTSVLPKTNNAADNSQLSSSEEEELFPKSKAVAPDELSGEEFSNSVSGESVASQQLVQDLEDAEFFAEHQDACNNNEPSENFPVELNLNGPLDPALEIQNLIDQTRQLSVMPAVDPSPDLIDMNDSSKLLSTTTDGDFVDPISNTQQPDILLKNILREESRDALLDNLLGEDSHDAFLENLLEEDSRDASLENLLEDDSHNALLENLLEEDSKDALLDNLLEEDSHDALLENLLEEDSKDALLDNVLEDDSRDALLEDLLGEDLKDKADGKSKRKHRKRKNRKPGKQNTQEEDKKPTTPNIMSNKQPTPQMVNKNKPQPQFQVTPQRPSNNMHHRKSNGNNFVPYPNVTVEDILKLPEHNRFLQKTGQVVYIIEKKHSRAAMGYIKKQQDNNPYWAIFSPTDHRLPRILIPLIDCPKDFYERPEDFKSSLFIAMIKEWDENSVFAKGRLARSLGEAGEIEPETEGILIENDVATSEFSAECLSSLPQLPWQIPQEELERRRDFRDQCVFTIDPKTARDLDDAVSVREIEDGMLEVGVHIADVTFFLNEGTALDVEASQRSTSVYLVQKVVPMLPRPLCEDLCSLNAGEDKLTFSVVWKITPEGDIMDEWFGRTVIHSCTKFSYEHAQDMIENGERDWRPEELPKFYGKFGPRDAFWSIQKLQSLATKLREKRFSSGALKLDQIKIQFALNHETGMPSGFSIYEQQDSHRLIEELMLLANMAVAHKIYKAFPEKAFLRCHPPPQTKMIIDLVDTLATFGIHLDPSSAGSLQASLARYSADDPLSVARMLVLTHLCSKPMRPARYFCTGWSSSPEEFHHYALNVPLYTHFTSPIRRYPDVIVHRLLAAALGLGQPPKQNALALQKLSVHCNDKKLTAKRVHELSCELFLGCFIREVGPLEEAAVVVDVMDHSFDVLITRMGVIKRVYCDKLGLTSLQFEKNLGIPKLHLTWIKEGNTLVQQITMFTLVEVVISSIPKEKMKFNVIIKPPKLQPAE